MVENLKLKFKDKKSFTHMAYKVIKSKVFSSILLFLSSIILIRHLPKEDFGLYVLSIAVFAFFELFMGGFDASLVRFILIIGKTKQHKLIATIFIIKTIITLISLFILYFLYEYSIDFLNIPQHKIELYKSVYILMSIAFVIKYITTTANNIITSYMLYDIAFVISLINGIFVLSSTLFVSYMLLGLQEYLSLLVVSNIIIMLMGLFCIGKSSKLSLKKLIKQINILAMKNIFKEYLLSYSTPLLGVGMLSYIKNYLPTYIFGTMVSLDILAVYSIFKKITDFLHKGYAGVIQGLYPKLFKMMDSKSKAIDNLFWIGLIVRLMVFGILHFGYKTILDIYNIQEQGIDYLLFITLISMFLLYYFGTVGTLIISFNKRTKEILFSSSILLIVSIFSVIFGYHLFGMVGLILGEMVSKFIGITLIVYFSRIYKDIFIVFSYFFISLFLVIFIVGAI